MQNPQTLKWLGYLEGDIGKWQEIPWNTRIVVGSPSVRGL